jgi:hypothetical protein
MMAVRQPAHPVESAAWSDSHWAAVLDRIEHRQANIGLKFWGPPLWLEVTMSGPDSEQWSIADTPGQEFRSWDWQSIAPCREAAELDEAGAGDDRLLEAASQYTIENLILNAVHEIGEWLRFDGRRVFPAHLPTPDAASAVDAVDTGDQGNGAVRLTVDFRPNRSHLPAIPPAANEAITDRASSRITEAAAAWRFTYLPGTRISYNPLGPEITDIPPGAPTPMVWRSAWSASTLSAVDGPTDQLASAVARDVHRMLVRYETDQICRAFHVDGRQPWQLEANDDVRPSTDAESLAISITYQQ